MNSDNLKYVIRQSVERVLPACKPRELILPAGTGKVVGLAGVRRSGKTFLFFDTIQRLAAQDFLALFVGTDQMDGMLKIKSGMGVECENYR